MSTHRFIAWVRSTLLRLEQRFLPSETLAQSKEKWNRLGRLNPRYYVWTSKGEGITEEEIRQTGLEDYRMHVKSDSLVQKTLGTFSARRALEIGCGIGRVAEPMSVDFAHVDGIDISEELIAHGVTRLAHLKNLTLRATDGRSYPFSDGSFDFVFSYLVFQHMADRNTVLANLREIGRVLKPNGIAKIQLRGIPIRKRAWSYGIWFDANSARDIARAAGLNPIAISGEGEKNLWVWLQHAPTIS